jgi:hypothetical protein
VAPGRIGVVGAGLAGLSAALELKHGGFEVDLFERSRLLGGKATSFTVGGAEVDNGPHVYLACCTEFIDFARQVGNRVIDAGEAEASPGRPFSGSEGPTSGTAGTLFLQDRFDALLLSRNWPPARLRAVALPAPWHLLPALLRYRYLRPLARLQVALALLRARKPVRPGETFATWLTRHHQGKQAREAFWDPFLIPALNAPLEEVAAEAALFVIATAFLTDAGAGRFGYARVPLGRLAEAAAAQLDQVYRRTAITRLEIESGDGTAATGGTPDPSPARGVRLGTVDGGQFCYDAVVLAVPPSNLQRLLHDPEQLGLHGLDTFRTAPIVDVHLWYDLPGQPVSNSGHPISDSGQPAPDTEGPASGSSFGFNFAALVDSPVQWVFEKGQGYLCCSISAADEYIGLPNAELIDLCHRELAGVLPMIPGPPMKGAVTRDREATFIPAPGLHRPGNTTICPRVVIAGTWTDTGWPATMESAVRSGRSAARALVRQLELGS